MSIPSALAVLRLMTSSYFDACSTGRSALLERCDAGLTAWIACSHVHEHADPPYLPRLLRPRRKGPRRYAAYKRDEFASPHGLPFRPTVEPYHNAE
jgi:hypothetical protein